MKLDKQRLPKEARKHGKQGKHIKSKLKEERRLKKVQVKSGMEIEVNEKPKLPESSVNERLKAKAIRKLSNQHNLQYKKVNQSRTHSNGPRAVTK